MAYSKKVASCIIGSGGKVYDEDPKGVIAVPFDEEFKIRVINKNDRRIGFDVFIDGVKVTKTGRIIVDAYERIDLERYIENDNNGTKFRYVPKDSEEAKMEGKDKEPYTGIVEVRAYFEKEIPKISFLHEHHYHHYDYPRPYWIYNTYHGYSGISGFSGTTGSAGTGNASFSSSSISPAFSSSSGSKNYTMCNNSSPDLFIGLAASNLEEGAVVRGSNSNQSFCSTHVDLEDDYVSLKMYLMGYYPCQSEKIRKKVEEVMVEKNKKYCTKCGHEIQIGDNFCGKCGGKV